MLSAGADIDTEDENGDTPFVHAFRGRYCAVMEVLHDAGCTTEIAKMSLALSTKDVAFVRLCHGMDIPVENEDWNAADPAEVGILLDDLALDPFEGQYGRHGFDDSPFMYIVQEGKPEILEMMVARHPCAAKYSDADRQEKIDRALFKAIKSRRLDNAKVLLASLGARLETRDVQGRTPFVLACGHDELIASYLLDLGANHLAVDNEGLTALHWAACAGYHTLSESLLERGVRADAAANLGATTLMVACSSRRYEIAELLLNVGGADPNLRTPEGWSALHVAVRACAPAIVRLLLTHDATPDVQSSKLTHNGDIVPASTPLLIAISLNGVKMIRHLLDANCDVDLAGLVYTNPSLSSSESEEEVKYQKQRCTPIQYAVISRAWDVAELLVKAGCDVAPVWLWLEYKKAPVHIPDDRYKRLRQLVHAATTIPPKLRQIVRLRVRRVLGRHLPTKVEKLELPPSARQFLLFHDLFRAQSGSFEV